MFKIWEELQLEANVHSMYNILQLLFTATKWGIIMQQFMRKFEQLNGVEANVTLEHCLFDKQRFYCLQLQTVNDDEKIGVTLKGHEIFVYKYDVKIAENSGDAYILSDGKLTIIVNRM